VSVNWEQLAAELTADLAKATQIIRQQSEVVRNATEAVQDSRATLAEVSSSRGREQTVDELVNSMVRQGYLVVDWHGNCYARSVEPTGGEYPLGLVRGLVRSVKPRQQQQQQQPTQDTDEDEEQDDQPNNEPTC
jgi:hypothetical protein